jgi:hypothetical protein
MCRITGNTKESTDIAVLGVPRPTSVVSDAKHGGKLCDREAQLSSMQEKAVIGVLARRTDDTKRLI